MSILITIWKYKIADFIFYYFLKDWGVNFWYVIFDISVFNHIAYLPILLKP